MDIEENKEIEFDRKELEYTIDYWLKSRKKKNYEITIYRLIILLIIGLNIIPFILIKNRVFPNFDGIFGILNALAGIFIFLIFKIIKKASSKYKKEYLETLLEVIFENSEYIRNKSINKELFYKSNILKEKNSYKYSGNDYLKIRDNDIGVVQCSSVHILEKLRRGGMVKKFSGLFFYSNIDKKRKDLDTRNELIIEINRDFDKYLKVVYKILIILGASVLITFFMALYGNIEFVISNFFLIITILSILIFSFERIVVKKDVQKGIECRDRIVINDKEANKIIDDEIYKSILSFQKKYRKKLYIQIKNNEIFFIVKNFRDLFEANIFMGRMYLKKDLLMLYEINTLNKKIVEKIMEK